MRWLMDKMKRLGDISRVSFRWKLICIYSLLLMVISSVAVFVIYRISVNQMMDISKEMAYEIQKKNIQILDERLIKIKENSRQAATDKELFSYLSQEKTLAEQNYLGLDRKITQILERYFSSEDVMSVNLITEDYVYGLNTSLLTAQRLRESPIYQEVLEKEGALVWTSIYDIVDMYAMEEYRNSALTNRWIFSAARTIGNGYVNSNGIYVSRPLNSESRPILLVNFPESMVGDIFGDSMAVQGASTYLLSKSGECVYSNGEKELDAHMRHELFEKVAGKRSGTDIISLGNKTVAISYVTSNVSGWTSVAIMPPDELMRQSRINMLATAAGIAVAAAVVGILISGVISSMVTRPIRQTVEAMQKLGTGHFDTQLEIKSQDDFGYLANGFNIMNQHISHLIEENYASKLRENEMEVMALNLQLNPHFLYNTLSVINYEALELGCGKVSDMIMQLCNMLNYTLRNKNETSLFREDLQWVQNYVDIMEARFEGKFEVFYDIPEELLGIRVPKLFLQPFIENAILHGFVHIESGGVILVNGYRDEDTCVIEVKDNGIGMKNSEEQLETRHQVGSIGIANMRQRIRLLFGEDYGIQIQSQEGKGTCIRIVLPFDSKPLSTF